MRHQHDHPADFCTLVLKGGYRDIVPCPWCSDLDRETAERGWCVLCLNRRTINGDRMEPGKFAYRKAEHRHTVAVDPGGCWTLLYFFPDRRKWGFWVPRRIDGRLKFKKSNKYFLEHGHHPCDQP